MYMDEKISVIIPVYNVEKYLRNCVDSIINQTYINLEIILVNDGSTDGSLSIIEEYKDKDERIKVINKVNGGLSSARNAGMEIATGKYISFIDSDDWIELDMYEVLINNITEYNGEIAIISTKTVDEDGNILEQNTDLIDTDIKIFNKQEIISRYLLGSWIPAWDKLYKRELFDQIMFPVGKINEDEAIMLKVFNQVNRVVVSKKAMYNYLKRPMSITTSRFSEKKFDWLDNAYNNMKYVEAKYPDLLLQAQSRYFKCMLSLSEEIILGNYSEFNSQVVAMSKKIHKNLNIIMKNPYLSKKHKIRAMMISTNIKLYKVSKQMYKNIRYK